VETPVPLLNISRVVARTSVFAAQWTRALWRACSYEARREHQDTHHSLYPVVDREHLTGHGGADDTGASGVLRRLASIGRAGSHGQSTRPHAGDAPFGHSHRSPGSQAGDDWRADPHRAGLDPDRRHALFFLTVVTPSFALLVVAQLLSGAGAAIWGLGREIAAIDLIRPNQRGRILALFFGINSAGSALGPVIGGVVTDWYGYRAVFVIAMLFSIGVIGLSAMIPETGKHAARTQSSMFDFGRLSDIDPMYRMTFIVVVLATFAQMIRMTVVNAMLPLRVETELGFSATEVGALFGIIGMVNLIVMGPAGWVSDRFGRKAATIPAAVLTAVSFLAYPFATDMWTLSAISVLIGIASGFALGHDCLYVRYRARSCPRPPPSTAAHTG
jgi:hypothetical protein